MKLSCLPVSLFNQIIDGSMPVAEWARQAREIGFDGIDMSVMFVPMRTRSYLSKLKKEIKAVGMPIVMMTSYPDFTHPDLVQRRREADYFISDIALASELEIKYLRITAGQNHKGIAVDEGVALVSDAFHRMDEVAKRYGVTLLFENHAKPGAWAQYDLSYNPKVFLCICERIKDTGVKINFDTGNAVAWGVDPLKILSQIYDMVEVIHISDMKQRGIFSPTAIGHGVVNNDGVIQYIKSKGFNNWICIEEASGQGLKGIKQARIYISQLLK